jgi:hypothetical protein
MAQLFCKIKTRLLEDKPFTFLVAGTVLYLAILAILIATL